MQAKSHFQKTYIHRTKKLRCVESHHGEKYSKHGYVWFYAHQYQRINTPAGVDTIDDESTRVEKYSTHWPISFMHLDRLYIHTYTEPNKYKGLCSSKIDSNAVNTYNQI